jgi:hypothetical protein
MFLLRVLALLLGLFLVVIALDSAIRTFVLPRASVTLISRLVFRPLRRVFNLFITRMERYEQRDWAMSLYAPIGLVLLVPVYLLVIMFAFALMFWGVGVETLFQAFATSGSSLLTLGFVTVNSTAEYALAFAEACVGMILTALLISYLPTIYSVFSQREALVTTYEVRLGTPPSGTTMIERYYLLGQESNFGQVWDEWSRWFAQLEESHTSLAPMSFFRSQQPDRSWITSAGAVLDAASLVRSSVDISADPRADLMIRSGYLALRSVAKSYFGKRILDDPLFPTNPISVTREEFNVALDHLKQAGAPIKTDRDQAWLDFAGWRVNYDEALLDLCDLVMAPEAPWSSDRSHGRWHLTPKFKTPNRVRDPELLKRAEKEAEMPNIK